MNQTIRRLLPVFALLLGVALPAQAQNYSLTNRAFVQSPQALGMGDAGVALPSAETAFFYNPAHLAHAVGLKPRITLLGLRGGFSDNVFDQVSFYKDDLEPAIDRGLENLDQDELRALYDEAFELGRERTFVNADVLLPSVMFRAGGIGLGAGLFAHSVGRYRFQDAGAGIPLVDFVGIGDLIAIGSMGIDFSSYGLAGLSVGLNAKMTQRYLTFKNKPLDAISPDEDVYLYKGSAVGLDVGVLYDVTVLPIPGNLRLGFAAYDPVGSDFDYAFDEDALSGVWPYGRQTPPNQEVIAQEEETINTEFQVDPSYRIGASYTVPSFLGLFKETGIAVDYIAYNNPPVDQVLLAHLHLGAQARVGPFALRAGLNQGYSTFGAGINLGFFRVDYAYFGMEEGRLPGQVPSWNHALQAAFGF